MDIAASLEDTFGYGYFSCAIIRHLVQQGVPVRLWPLLGHRVPPDLKPLVMARPPKKFDVVFCSVIHNPLELTGRVLYTMYEADAMPAVYGQQLTRYDHVVVPTAFGALAIQPWHESVHISPLGADMKWTPPVFKPFTFTAVAADHNVPERKRIQELVDVFSTTFPREPDVRLQLKRNPECTKIHTFDSRVQIVTARLPRKTYEDLIAATTVGVQVSAMEGWGLPVNEFMAAGRPVVAPIAGAIADFLPPEAAFPVEYSYTSAPQNLFDGIGSIPFASITDLGAKMRFAYENPIEVVRRGLAAFTAAQNFTTHLMGQRFLTLCQRLLS